MERWQKEREKHRWWKNKTEKEHRTQRINKRRDLKEEVLV